jgi:hypothetical protein
MIKLTNDTFAIYAAKCYDNPACESLEDFHSDLERFLHLKKLLLKVKNSGTANQRLILNHIITLHNIFGKHVLEMLFLKIPKDCWSLLKTYLVFLNYLPDNFYILDQIMESDIPLSDEVIKLLRIV